MSTYRIRVRVTQEEHPRTHQLEFHHSPLAIGALPRNDIVLDDPRVSGDHAILSLSRRALVLEDVSRNGTFVGGRKVQRHALRPGEDVMIPPFRLSFELELFAVDRATVSAMPDGPDRSASLVVITGPEDLAGRTFRVDGSRLRLGRAPDADASIPEQTLSRLHAEVVRVAPGRFAVRDLRSANGTFLNGEKTRFASLHEGDRVGLGENVILEFRLDDAVPPAQPKPAT